MRVETYISAARTLDTRAHVALSYNRFALAVGLSDRAEKIRNYARNLCITYDLDSNSDVPYVRARN